MINLKQLLLGALVLTGGISSYAQSNIISEARKQSRNTYMGYDQARTLAEQQRDTTFVRYFIGNFQVEPTDAWTNKIKYKGYKESENRYIFNSANYVKGTSQDELKLRKEWRDTYTIKDVKNIKTESKMYLLDGLVEEVVYQNKEKKAKCIDKEGKVLNDTGCLRYTIAPQDKKEITSLQVIATDAARKATRKKGMLPKYKLTNLVADYDTKSWKVYQVFPADFDKSNPMYENIKTAVEKAFKDKKVDEVYYNKDINGNYYDNIFFVNGSYN